MYKKTPIVLTQHKISLNSFLKDHMATKLGNIMSYSYVWHKVWQGSNIEGPQYDMIMPSWHYAESKWEEGKAKVNTTITLADF